ncbi:glycosyltransferase family 2 protein [candidate division KSB1 bacterium]|nr:glycosyltransferase family 2 protein [candidate division KSB1 bacterium]
MTAGRIHFKGQSIMGTSIRVTSVTLSWKGKEVLLRCIRSLKAQTHSLSEIIVVDNHSQDGSVEAVREAFPDVVVLENPTNFGAPKGRNVGLRRALEKPVDYIFTLDNDLYAAPDCVEKMIAPMDKNKDIATVGAFIYDDSDPDILLSAGAIVDYTQNVSRQLRNVNDPDKLYPISYCGTGHMMTRASVYREVGLLDEGFIGYGFEDTDFGMRTRKSGYNIVSYGRARVWHTAHANIGNYTFRKKYLESLNAIRFMKRYGTLLTWPKYLFFMGLSLVGAALIQIPKGRKSGVIGKCRGVFDGLFGRTSLAEKILLASEKEYV